jgi:hypothetical protein
LELFLDLRAQLRPLLEAGPKNPGRAEKGVPSPNIKNLKIKWGFFNFLQKIWLLLSLLSCKLGHFDWPFTKHSNALNVPKQLLLPIG